MRPFQQDAATKTADTSQRSALANTYAPQEATLAIIHSPCGMSTCFAGGQEPGSRFTLIHWRSQSLSCHLPQRAACSGGAIPGCHLVPVARILQLQHIKQSDHTLYLKLAREFAASQAKASRL